MPTPDELSPVARCLQIAHRRGLAILAACEAQNGTRPGVEGPEADAPGRATPSDPKAETRPEVIAS